MFNGSLPGKEDTGCKENKENAGKHELYFDREEPHPFVEVLPVRESEQSQRKHRDEGDDDKGIVGRLREGPAPQHYGNKGNNKEPHDNPNGYVGKRRMERVVVSYSFESPIKEINRRRWSLLERTL